VTGIRSPLACSRTRRRADSAATASSTGTGFIRSAAVMVANRRSRVVTVRAASTPARNSPIVMTETASSSGNASTSSLGDRVRER
jgi:hypothetical protein